MAAEHKGGSIMAQIKKKGISLRGSLKKDNITIYSKGGKLIMRSATSEMPLRRTRSQFVARQRIAHSVVLWKRLKENTEPFFLSEQTGYHRFVSLMRKTPDVFLTQWEYRNYGSLLLPGMAVSDGTMPDIDYYLGTIASRPALITSLTTASPLPYVPTGTDMVRALCGKKNRIKEGDTLRLYIIHQVFENMIPKIYITTENVVLKKGNGRCWFDEVEPFCEEGRLVLSGETFNDSMKGWALVHISGGNCSSQKVCTRCTLYEQYSTEEAMLRAAESYGGLTKTQFLTPNTN